MKRRERRIGGANKHWGVGAGKGVLDVHLERSMGITGIVTVGPLSGFSCGFSDAMLHGQHMDIFDNYKVSLLNVSSDGLLDVFSDWQHIGIGGI